MARAKLKSLYSAIMLLRTTDEVEAFFRDLMTETELKELAKRWTCARMLQAGEPYVKIIEATSLSSTTVARVSRYLKNGAGGYRLILKRANEESPL